MDFYEVVSGDDLHQKLRNFKIIVLLFDNFSVTYFMKVLQLGLRQLSCLKFFLRI